MARIFQTGWENVTSTDNCFASTTGGPEVLTGASARSGNGYLRINGPGAAENVRYQFATSNQTNPHFFRAYIYIVAAPTANKYILRTFNFDLSAARYGIKLTTDLKLQLFNIEDNAQIGSDSAALSLSTWYRVEYTADLTTLASSTLSAGIDGVEFAAGTANFAAGVGYFLVGSEVSDATLDIYYDDAAINNDSGSFQNSWCGSGKIIHLRPNATGDANGFLTQVGGTVGSSNNFTRVDEVTPNDATDYNASAIAAEDLFNVDDSGIGANNNINVVAVGAKFANLVAADATTAFKVELEKTSGGTKAQSSAIIPNSTTWRVNASAAPFIYPLVTYQDPDAANWTQSTLDSMQIGYTITATNVQAIAVTGVWASVDYTPRSSVKQLGALGVG